MNIIPCSKKCKFQKDGYCNCEGTMVITNFIDNQCPYFCEKDNKEKVLNEKNKLKPDFQ